MDETRLALSRPPVHNILWNRREFLFRFFVFFVFFVVQTYLTPATLTLILASFELAAM